MKVFLSYLFFICLLKSVSSNEFPRAGSGKIVGGFNTNIQSFPYQAFLLMEKNNKYFQCGGSIINRYIILTAAHCLVGISKVFVRTGTSKTYGGTITIAYNFTYHPNYNPRTNDYDVGIVKLVGRLRLDGVTTKAVRLAKKDSIIVPGTEILISGWGATSEMGSSSSNLMAVEVPIVSNEDCRRSYRSLTERMFCAGLPEGGKDSCQGDSGGPAVSKESGVQLGIVSFGIGCARKRYPGVYTRIGSASIREWIKQVSGV